MTLLPVAPWWLIAVFAAVTVGFAAWAGRQDPRRRRAWLRRAGIAALLAVIALRPGIPDPDARAANTNVDVFFVVDTTSSIVAEDHDGGRPRLEGVAEDVVAIADALPGARFTLLTFDQIGRVELPLTDDTTALRTAVEVLQPEIAFYSAGSSPLTAVEVMAERLTAAQEQEPDRTRVVFLMTDGETTSSSPPDASFASLADLVDDGAVLGYGTAEGGRMLENSGYETEARYIQDNSESPSTDAISRIDEAALTAIAGELDVDYAHRTAPGGLEDVVDVETGGLEATDEELAGRADLGWLLAVPLLALVLWEGALLVPELLAIGPARRRGDDDGKRRLTRGDRSRSTTGAGRDHPTAGDRNATNGEPENTATRGDRDRTTNGALR
ncbi:vWA domain-containing protein [Occultella kanbiaonis]|uniref:vWA domain-containing protein n=1 Tax=Occultella kanbiaonis TaxID=2675754 RepID=UPI0012B8521D|nr:vWA domain-containing protein [Occultella kanbiaonis]